MVVVMRGGERDGGDGEDGHCWVCCGWKLSVLFGWMEGARMEIVLSEYLCHGEALVFMHGVKYR